MAERVKVLVTGKTYPLPSQKYGELVCTAGVREDGSFIRLYPISYRDRDNKEQFKKYEWIEVAIEKHQKDPRPESFRPLGEIRRFPPPLDTNQNWKKRKEYVFKKGVSTMCELAKKPQTEVSLGIVKALRVENFLIESDQRTWRPRQIAQMQQLNLFGPKRQPLEKIPYKFSYKFFCEFPGCKGHQMSIHDWELGQLYRRMRDQYPSETVACEKVKERFLGKICAQDKDTHFFVGTALRHGVWIILGAFWPKKSISPSESGTLFQ